MPSAGEAAKTWPSEPNKFKAGGGTYTSYALDPEAGHEIEHQDDEHASPETPLARSPAASEAPFHRGRGRLRSCPPWVVLGVKAVEVRGIGAAWGRGFARPTPRASRLTCACLPSAMPRSTRTLGRGSEDSDRAAERCSCAHTAGWRTGLFPCVAPSRWHTRQPLPCYVLDVGGPETLGQSTCRRG